MGRVEACRICLVTGVKMERIEGSLETNIKSVFGHNVLYSSDLPEYSCYECTAMITKFSKFRKKYLMSQSLLFSILQNHGVVTEKHIKEIDREATKLNSTLSTSNLTTNSNRQVLEVKLECDPIENELDMDVEEEMYNSGSDDDVPLHSVKQIEHVNINSVNKKQPTNNKRKYMDNQSNYGESSRKNNGRNENVIQDFDVNRLADQADSNGVVYLQADDFDPQLPEMDNAVEEYNNTASHLSLKILENQNVMINNQNAIMSKLSDFSVRLHRATTSCSSSVNTVTGSAPYRLSADSSTPFIETKKQIDDFENDLEDPEKRQMLREKYSILFNGRGNGYTCGYLLVDAIFSRKFMTLCSWAGGSRGDGTKFPFRGYKNTISFFHEIIHDCDSNFSMMDCYSFFKNILRNSVKRCTSKFMRMSTGRQRRSKLKKNKEVVALENT